MLLWALALELDERGATFTGEQVCRECSGRGARIVALDQSVIGGLRHVPARARGTEFDVTCARNRWTADIVVCPKPVHAHDGARTTRLVMMPCPFCAIGRHTRPVTVSLEWLVRKLAAADPFRAELTGWPDAWQAQLDRWQASGETHWRAQWWLAFAEWAVGGKVPDEHQLARLLAMRIPELRERLLFDRQRRALRPKDRNVRIGNLSARSVITPVQGQPEVEAVADAVFGQLADGLPDFVPRTRREWTLYESSPRLQNERQHVFVWATAERTPFGFIEFTAQAFVSREADGRIVVIGSTRGDLETRS
ncbi:MAG TPA: hypothetical protein VM869_35795 [Enhygromyxa sp.]|nr:hypothetical protein [Enhygromyxa sp.]